jgi:predicted TIM-barrel fold metal-dependent hydrolase
MQYPSEGVVDCDLHIAVPSLKALLPYMDEYWRSVVLQRGVRDLESTAYPPNSPLSCRPDWRPASGKAGADLDLVRTQALDAFGSRYAICNCLYAIPLLHSEDMAAAFARALNDWIAREWLDEDARLRASIVAPIQNPQLAAQEIDRCAADRRFVQVLMPAMDEMPLGKRHYWPIYEAAARHGLPVGIHAGSSYRHPTTGIGWAGSHMEDYASQAQAFQSLLASLVCEGVFAKFPDLRVVFIESGFTWLPAHLWRLDKHWRGLRSEVPWVKSAPSEIVRRNIRFTVQPIDAPPDAAGLARLFEHMGSDDLLLFSTDYPHWQFDGEAALPDGLPAALARRIMVDNPMATYPRLQEAAP